jgi:hypothetical protein
LDLKVDLYVDIGSPFMLVGGGAAQEIWNKATEKDEFRRLSIGRDEPDKSGLSEGPRLATTRRFRH